MANRLVVDTMVFIYSYFNVFDFRLEADEALLRVGAKISAIDILPQEMLNAGYNTIRFDSSRDQADILRAVERAERTVRWWIPARPLFARAAELSLAKKHHTYDTLLVAAAESLDGQVLTFDRTMARKFGRERVLLVSEFLAG